MPEFDSPGHSKSMCKGGPPGICVNGCSASSNWPLRPTQATMRFLHSMWEEWMGDVFQSNVAHIGGDEVKPACWDEDTVSARALATQNITSNEGYIRFVNTVAQGISDLGINPIMWNDAFKVSQPGGFPTSFNGGQLLEPAGYVHAHARHAGTYHTGSRTNT